jgi:glyoxylase-like metal-dependent hydrolase (beta-lactamase superfamily II)
MDFTVISIGTLSKNPLWQERTPLRTSHSTTTLIRAGEAVILVDPSLPGQILEARLFERTGLKPDAVTHIFLTNLKPVHRRGLDLFPKAVRWAAEIEIQAAQQGLAAAARHVADETEAKSRLAAERQLLAGIDPAPDQLADGVDLFPLPGYTPGQAGLLLKFPARSVMITGDAVPTQGHFEAGQVFQESFDIQQAKESLAEVYEIADVIVPGHDNVFVNPRGV